MCLRHKYNIFTDRIGGVMVLFSSAVVRYFDSQSSKTKDYKIGIVAASPISTQH